LLRSESFKNKGAHMLKQCSKKTILVLISFLFFSKIYAKDIPTIVIAPSKKPQSISTVGTSVTVYSEKDIENSSESFLHNILNYGSPGISAYQSGGPGTQSGIQIRNLPKRYTTIYIDGVKMSDPSTVSNDYYFDDLLKGSISRIEILRGNQSSLYGSGAMGGTVNITTKKGKPGFQKEFNAITGSDKTINLSGAVSGADEKNDFWLGYENFHTAGDSAMTDNDEADSYHNDTFVGNYGYKINDKFKFESNARLINSFLNYDSVDSSTNPTNDDNNQNWNKEWNGSLGLVHEPFKNFNHSLKKVKSVNNRTYNAFSAFGSSKAKSEYIGFRDAYYYSGNYNFNLDNSITFGSEYENDEADLKKTNYRGTETVGAYFDVQNRLTENLYTTFGMRFDDNDHAGNEDSHRVSFAYLTGNNNTKIHGTYGTSYRYPSLVEQFDSSAWKESADIGNLTAEVGKSHDIGIGRSFLENKLNLDLTYFNHEYTDNLAGWKDSASDVNSYYHNQPGLVKSEGFELGGKWLAKDNLNFNLAYTLSRTYDGEDADDANNADGNTGGTGGGAFTDTRMVRVPRHMLGLNTYYKFPNKKISLNLQTIGATNSRDYGNYNSPKHGSNYADVKLPAYFVNHLSVNLDFIPNYDVFFKITNLTNEDYHTALHYSQPGRGLSFGLKKSFD
jgi:vitamin B12 transporter